MKARLESIIVPKATNYALLRIREPSPADTYSWPMDVRLTADDLRAWALRFNRAAEELDESPV